MRASLWWSLVEGARAYGLVGELELGGPRPDKNSKTYLEVYEQIVLEVFPNSCCSNRAEGKHDQSGEYIFFMFG